MGAVAGAAAPDPTRGQAPEVAEGLDIDEPDEGDGTPDAPQDDVGFTAPITPAAEAGASPTEGAAQPASLPDATEPAPAHTPAALQGDARPTDVIDEG